MLPILEYSGAFGKVRGPVSTSSVSRTELGDRVRYKIVFSANSILHVLAQTISQYTGLVYVFAVFSGTIPLLLLSTVQLFPSGSSEVRIYVGWIRSPFLLETVRFFC